MTFKVKFLSGQCQSLGHNQSFAKSTKINGKINGKFTSKLCL